MEAPRQSGLDRMMDDVMRGSAAELRRDGRPLGDAEAQSLARERLMTSRRRALVADWLDGLKRRAAITRPTSATP